MYYWDRKDVPHKGWMNIGCEDLEEATHICDMCGKEEIRYVHTMYHSEMEDYYKVGCVCAEKMTNDYETAKQQLKEMKKKTSWMNTNWKHLDCHEYEHKTFNSKNGRITIGIFECDGEYRFHHDNFIFTVGLPSKRKLKDLIYEAFVVENVRNT